MLPTQSFNSTSPRESKKGWAFHSILLLTIDLRSSVTIFPICPPPYMLKLNNLVLACLAAILFRCRNRLSSLKFTVGCPVKAIVQQRKECLLCARRSIDHQLEERFLVGIQKSSGRPRNEANVRDARQGLLTRSTCHTHRRLQLCQSLLQPDGTSASGIWYQVEVSWETIVSCSSS